MHTIIGAAFLAQQAIENTAELVKRGLFSRSLAEAFSQEYGKAMLQALLKEKEEETPQDIKFDMPLVHTVNCARCGERYVSGGQHACMGEV